MSDLEEIGNGMSPARMRRDGPPEMPRQSRCTTDPDVKFVGQLVFVIRCV